MFSLFPLVTGPQTLGPWTDHRSEVAHPEVLVLSLEPDYLQTLWEYTSYSQGAVQEPVPWK